RRHRAHVWDEQQRAERGGRAAAKGVRRAWEEGSALAPDTAATIALLVHFLAPPTDSGEERVEAGSIGPHGRIGATAARQELAAGLDSRHVRLECHAVKIVPLRKWATEQDRCGMHLPVLTVVGNRAGPVVAIPCSVEVSVYRVDPQAAVDADECGL